MNHLSTCFQSRRPSCRWETLRVFNLSSIRSFAHVLCCVAAILTFAVGTSCLGAVVSLGPLPYLSTADSPLLADPTLDVVLEDFEDGLFNVPGVIVNPIENTRFPFEPFVNDGQGVVVGPGTDTDSVDADDGVIDGWGNEGHALRSTAELLDLSATFNSFFSFSFTPTTNGSYPNAFGFVWTDGEPERRPEIQIVVREVDDVPSIGPDRFQFLNGVVDNEFDGSTAEDRFFGFLSNTGIVSVGITSSFSVFEEFLNGVDPLVSDRQLFFEMDHLQFGYTRVPEPASVTLLGIAIVVLLTIRTKRAAIHLLGCRGRLLLVFNHSPIRYLAHVLCSVAALLTFAAGTSCLGAVVSIGPLPYLSTADSPFLSDPTLDVVLEDFEDGLFNVPGVISEPIDPLNPFHDPFVNDGRGVVVGPGADTDSVDADDGVIDGWGNDGHAFRSTAEFVGASFPPTFLSSIFFRLLPNSNGSMPNAFGFVWTDGEPGPSSFGVPGVAIELGVVEIDSAGLTTIHNFFPSFVGDDEFDGGTAEDQFIGVTSDNEIVSVVVFFSFLGLDEFDDGSNRQLFFEMDHLQFGYTRVPEPTSLKLCGFTFMLMVVGRRTR